MESDFWDVLFLSDSLLALCFLVGVSLPVGPIPSEDDDGSDDPVCSE